MPAPERPEFSMSVSTARELEQCPRAYYGRRYGSWGGWKPGPPRRQLAYLLKKAVSVPGLVGSIFHEATAGFIRDAREPAMFRPSADDLIARAERLVVDAIENHREARYDEDPKRYPAILDVYYGKAQADQALISSILGQIAACVRALVTSRHLSRLADGAELVAVEQVFTFEFYVDDVGPVTVYVVPDLVYHHRKRYFIVDWKTGRARPEHTGQLGIYARWLRLHRPDADKLSVFAVMLKERREWSTRLDGEAHPAPGAVARLEQAARIAAALVEGGDIERNQPRPMSAFAQLPEGHKSCRWCRYRRLCKRE